MEVVVVLPWVPDTPTAYFMRMSSPSISARRITGTLCFLAFRISGLDSGTAEE